MKSDLLTDDNSTQICVKLRTKFCAIGPTYPHLIKLHSLSRCQSHWFLKSLKRFLYFILVRSLTNELWHWLISTLLILCTIGPTNLYCIYFLRWLRQLSVDRSKLNFVIEQEVTLSNHHRFNEMISSTCPRSIRAPCYLAIFYITPRRDDKVEIDD